MFPARRMPEDLAIGNLNANNSRGYRWKNRESNHEASTKGASIKVSSGGNIIDKGSSQIKLHKTPEKPGVPREKQAAGPEHSPLDIGTFVKTYVDRRTVDYTDNPSSNTNIRRNLHERKAGWPPKYLVPLRFDEDVMFYRLEDKRVPKVSFRDADMTEMYRVEPTTARRGDKDRLARKTRPALATKHRPCLPADPHISREVLHTKNRLNTGKVSEEKERGVTSTKTTHLWEKHVLGLISRRTAQWIANQCSSGDQRDRLVHFLDEKYFEHYLQEGGAVRVTKILDVNDDAICWPVKRKTHPENV